MADFLVFIFLFSGFFVLLGWLHTLLGLIFVRFDCTHSLGLRLFDMGFIPSLSSKYCKLPCSSTRCCCKFCPNFNNPDFHME